jgi:hypothetical protein
MNSTIFYTKHANLTNELTKIYCGEKSNGKQLIYFTQNESFTIQTRNQENRRNTETII